MMRLLGRVMLFILVVLVAVAWAGEKSYMVTIYLTRAQANKVKNAHGRVVVVEFTEEQIKGIQELLPEFNLTEMKLTTTHLQRGNTVVLEVLELHAPDGMDDPRARLFEANPQPSP
jgi:hypothetical protein